MCPGKEKGYTQQGDETDPLICPKCQRKMRIISFIDQPGVIQKILENLGLLEESQAPADSRKFISLSYHFT
jgi:hypothetical protein